MFAFLLFGVALPMVALRTPRPVAADGPETEFSARRAIQHDYVIATEPHPMGSPANEKVAHYIVEAMRSFGVDTDLVSTLVAGGNSAGQRDMVLARIPGASNTKAFALMAHYDSVPYGPGAADDCSGVIAMLEIARALKAGPPLMNDIVFVFTDGEEGSKHGSRSFAEHPWFNEVGVLTNLEARGTKGNSMMFGTCDQNGWLIENFVAGVRYPCASSLGFDVYKRMPFSTDFDTLRPLGMKGFDIAFTDNFAWYHTMNDTPEHLDLGTLQQHGMYGLDMARHFGSIPLDGDLTAPDKMYFNTLGYRMVYYPLAWGGPLAWATAVLVVVVIVVGRVRNHISILGAIAGVILVAVTAVVSAAVTVLMLTAIWGQETVLNIYTEDFTRIPDLYPVYHNNLYVAAFAAATASVAALIYGPICRWIRAQSLLMGAYVWWTAIMLALVHYLPGASYLLMWPLACSALGMGVFFLVAKPENMHPAWIALLAIAALPVLILCTPFYWTIGYTVLIMAAPGLAAFAVLILGMLIPQLDLMGRINGWWLPALGTSVAAALVVFGLANSSFTPERPKLDALSYGIDYDTNQAFWLSSDPTPDEWTAQFFEAGAPREDFSEFAPSRGEKVMKALAPIAADFPGPELIVVSDVTADGVRELIFHVASPAKAARLDLQMVSETEVLAASVFGKTLAGETRDWRLIFNLFPREGADVTLRVPPGAPVRLRAREIFYSVPEIPGFRPRPDTIICRPNTVDHHGSNLENHRTWVVRTVEL